MKVHCLKLKFVPCGVSKWFCFIREQTQVSNKHSTVTNYWCANCLLKKLSVELNQIVKHIDDDSISLLIVGIRAVFNTFLLDPTEYQILAKCCLIISDLCDLSLSWRILYNVEAVRKLCSFEYLKIHIWFIPLREYAVRLQYIYLYKPSLTSVSNQWVIPHITLFRLIPSDN